MRIVGYNLSHDSSIAIVEDGRVVSALALERLSRVKRGTVPLHAFASEMAKLTAYVLGDRHLRPDDIDYWIATSTETQDLEEDRLLFSLLGRSNETKVLQMPFPGHHMAHASAAFHCSGFERAGVLVVDAYGARVDGQRERETAYLFQQGQAPAQLFQYRRDSVRVAGRLINNKLCIPESFSGIGELYRVVTLGLGFFERGTSYDDAGKTMGLAAYGTPFSKEPVFIRKDPSGLSFERASDSLRDLGLIESSDMGMLLAPYLENSPGRIRREDIAAQIQDELERACIGLAEDVVSITGERRLAASGGCFLNSVLNRRLLVEGIVDDLFVFPAATDDGNAPGAALYAHNHLVASAPAAPRRIHSVYWGPDCPDNEAIQSIARQWGANNTLHRSVDAVAQSAAAAIARGEIVGWFQGRSEFGPRALGGRSILCHPGIPGMKEKLNRRVKFREAFRPFAASVLLEDAKDWFNLPVESSPFMLIVCDVLPEHADEVREIVHVDGTCRIQTIAADDTSPYRKLLFNFKEISGLPLVLNTSFNLRGMPIVEQPGEALDCLFGSRLDRIFIRNVEIAAPEFARLTPKLSIPGKELMANRSAQVKELSFLEAIDGRRSLAAVAEVAGIDIAQARDTALELRHMQVLDWNETPSRPLPRFVGEQYEPSES